MDTRAFFFPPSLSCSSPFNFLEKTSACSLEDARYRDQIVHLTSCLSHSLSHLCLFSPPPLPPSALLYFPSSPHPCCVFILTLSLALPLLNNNPSVFKCVCGAIFGPSKATKHSLLSCSFSLFLCFWPLLLYGSE